MATTECTATLGPMQADQNNAGRHWQAAAASCSSFTSMSLLQPAQIAARLHQGRSHVVDGKVKLPAPLGGFEAKCGEDAKATACRRMKQVCEYGVRLHPAPWLQGEHWECTGLWRHERAISSPAKLPEVPPALPSRFLEDLDSHTHALCPLVTHHSQCPGRTTSKSQRQRSQGRPSPISSLCAAPHSPRSACSRGLGCGNW